MKRFSILAACVMSFSLGTLVRLPRAKAQTNSPTQKRMYYQVDYMKTRHGRDPYKLEHDVWGPIHKEMIKNGTITSWSMMQPLYAGAHNYDYITVTGFQSLKDLENTDYPAIFNKVWGKTSPRQPCNKPMTLGTCWVRRFTASPIALKHPASKAGTTLPVCFSTRMVLEEVTWTRMRETSMDPLEFVRTTRGWRSDFG